jgi:malate dehydrogenase (oxaloacetate-decarboxylating)(NADP+)
LAYTPGVATPCRAIQRHPDSVYRYTDKGNLVAIVSNGTAVLGLGNLGPLAAKPVMEGKSLLFKRLADVDAFDLELDVVHPEALVRIVTAMAPTLGGIIIPLPLDSDVLPRVAAAVAGAADGAR